MLTLKDFMVLVRGTKAINNQDALEDISNTAFTTGVRPYLIRRVLEDIVVLLLIGFGILAAVFYMLLFQHGLGTPKYNVYYPINKEGQAIHPTNPSVKHYPTVKAEAFAMQALDLSYNYNYTNWRYQLNRLAPLFNESGWKQYMGMLKKHNLIASLKNDNLDVYSSVRGPSVLMGSGVVNNSYMWRFKTPITMHYNTLKYSGTQKLFILVTVAQANPDFYPEGLRVVSITALSRD